MATLSGPTPEQVQQQKQAEAEAAAESAKRAARAEAIRRLEELNAWRLEPLGMDRRFNRYWLLCCPDFSVTSVYTGAADDFPNSTNYDIPGKGAACRACCGRVSPALPYTSLFRASEGLPLWRWIRLCPWHAVP